MSAALAVAAVLLWLATPDPRLRRLRAPAERNRLTTPARGAAWFGALLLLPLPWSLPVAWATSVALVWGLQRLKPAAAVSESDVAMALDLMAACLRAGATAADAAASVARCVTGPASVAMGRASRAMRSGVDPAVAWDGLVGIEGESMRIARSALRRSLDSGAGLADALERAAKHIRGSAAVARQARLHATTVRVVLPLALCFLPAFVLVGVIPIVAGIATGIF